MTRSSKRITGAVTAMIFFLYLSLVHSLHAQPHKPSAESQSVVSSEHILMDELPSGTSMSDMMRGPQITAQYPIMIGNLEPTAEERARMEQGARMWVSEGTTMLTEGAAALTQATRQNDVKGMNLAGEKIKQGLSRLQSGISTSQALRSGKPAAEVALDWFNSQLNLDVKQVESGPPRFLGMGPLQLFICLLMLASIGIALVIYLLRMRRAYHLLERINAVEQ